MQIRVTADDGQEWIIPANKSGEFQDFLDSRFLWHEPIEPPFWARPADNPEDILNLIPAIAMVLLGTYVAVCGLSMIF